MSVQLEFPIRLNVPLQEQFSDDEMLLLLEESTNEFHRHHTHVHREGHVARKALVRKTKGKAFDKGKGRDNDAWRALKEEVSETLGKLSTSVLVDMEAFNVKM